MVVFGGEIAGNREKPEGYLTAKQATVRREW
jgi:hypothetical protein